jgi:nitrate/nitrite-specific signal transduction histidine kinase
MTLRLLKIFTIVAPIIFIGLFEIVRHHLFVEDKPMLIGNLILLAAVTIAAFFFSRYIFGVIKKTQRDNLRRNEELKALNSVALAANESLNLEVVLYGALDRVIQTTAADAGKILLLDEEGKLVERRVSSGFPSEIVQDKDAFSSEESVLVDFIISGKGMVVPDLPHDARLSESSIAQRGFRSLVAVPLISENNNIGAILVTGLAPRRFNDEDLQLLNNMGYQISIAIKNARLHEQVQLLSTLEERERIAREMHDGIAQVLSYVGTKSQAARQLISTGHAENARDQLLQLEDVAQDLYNDVREAILGLRSTISTERDMTSTLEEYILNFSQMSNIRADLEIKGNSILSVSTTSQIQITRIIQEALSNVRKHAKASHASVQISTSNNRLEIIIADDGKGFDVSNVKHNGWPHFGLQTMKERSDSIGGILDIRSTPDEGTKVVLTMPIDKGVEYESAAG